ncbi:MAG: hydroxyacid dehydrogenase [Candidatus Magasanikbacteria bacterium]|nr:hydroxyacid dehydrogenase [Candidatus Magasanikbacteria bacterium]
MPVNKKSRVVFYGLWPELHNYTRTLLRAYSCALHSEKISIDNVDPHTDILAVFIESPVTKEIMGKMSRLKLISAMSTGYDHIDLKAAKKGNISVANVPTYGENTVAEHTFALILGLTRKLFESVKRVKEGKYDFDGLRGMDLKDKTLGIIGTGHIGSHVIRMAKGFDMQVVAYDVKPNRQLSKTMGFAYVSLNELLKKSDIVSLHTPLFKETYHLINKKNIKLMKPGSLLINTARGGLVEPEALLQALNEKRLAGAGLDVLEDENLLQNFEEVMNCGDNACKLKTSLINNLIIDHPNTIVTPHNAFNSTEALQRIIDVTVSNIKDFIAGRLKNKVV